MCVCLSLCNWSSHTGSRSRHLVVSRNEACRFIERPDYVELRVPFESSKMRVAHAFFLVIRIVCMYVHMCVSVCVFNWVQRIQTVF